MPPPRQRPERSRGQRTRPKPARRASVPAARLLAELLVLAFERLEDTLAVSGHGGVLVAKGLDFALELLDLPALGFEALETLVLRIDLALVHRDPFLVDSLAIHEGIGRDHGLGPASGRLLDLVVGIEDVHGTENRDRAAKPEHEHLLALLRLRVLGDRATGIERVVLVHLGGIEILGFALEEIHDAYLPAGTTT